MARSALHRARIRRRASMFERQLSVALPMLSSSLRAGAALNTALRHLAENGEAPLSQELGLLREQRLGIPGMRRWPGWNSGCRPRQPP